MVVGIDPTRFLIFDFAIDLYDAVAYPQLVSGGVSESHKSKWLVKVGVSMGVTP